MRLIKPDANRRIALEGVAQPVPRPVDIDATQAGFKALRTLRIYRFPEGTHIDGHAEEDEVFIVVLQGTIELHIRTAEGKELPCTLAAPHDSSNPVACAAYLPVHGQYALRACTGADVAYMRATPKGTRPAASFTVDAAASARSPAPALLDVGPHAERLRLRLFRLAGSPAAASRVELSAGGSMPDGALLHVRVQAQGQDQGAGPMLHMDGRRESLKDWDTIVLPAGARVALGGANGADALALLVWAE